MTINNHRRFNRFAAADANTGPTPGELLSASYHEMLAGYRNLYDRTGDLFLKEIIDRAEHALALNQ